MSPGKLRRSVVWCGAEMYRSPLGNTCIRQGKGHNWKQRKKTSTGKGNTYFARGVIISTLWKLFTYLFYNSVFPLKRTFETLNVQVNILKLIKCTPKLLRHEFTGKQPSSFLFCFSVRWKAKRKAMVHSSYKDFTSRSENCSLYDVAPWRQGRLPLKLYPFSLVSVMLKK